MWGKVVARPRAVFVDGITPAHAGKSVVKWEWTEVWWGSPPHMQGKDQILNSYLDCPGITPAHAGKSHAANLARGSLGDHPRTCGEKKFSVRRQVCTPGSPPRMRGKVAFGGDNIDALGITPAHAGKSA